MINLSCRNYALFIDDLDCTQALISIEGNYDHYQTGKGYVTISASLTLQRAIGFTENLDDRTNSRWMRGKEIQFYIANESLDLTRCPVLGHLYILTSQYDGINTLKIEAGCILALLDFRTPAGDGVCFQPGNSTQLNTIASELLTAAGVTNFSLSISGNNLNVPIPKLTNESFIGLFGKLCFANNYLAYQDKYGTVRTRLIITNANSLKSLVCGQHELDYKPLNGNETPSEIYKVSGVVKNFRDLEDLAQDAEVKEEIGGYTNPESGFFYYGLISRISSENDIIDTETRTVTSHSLTEKITASILTRWMPEYYGLCTYQDITTISYYEAEANVTKCSDIDEGKLFKTEETILSPRMLVFDQYYANLQQLFIDANEELVLAGYTNLVIASKTITTYSFENIQKDLELLEESPNYPLLGKVAKITEFYHPLGSFIFEAVTETEERSAWYLTDETQLVLVNKIEEVWEETSQNEWKYDKEDKKSWYLKDPSAVVAQMQKWRDEDVALTSYSFFWDLREIEYTNKPKSYTSNQPPAPERFPKTTEVWETQLVEIERFPSYSSEYKEKIKEIQIESGFLLTKSQARSIAKLEADLTWGKYKGNNSTTALFDDFLDITPLDAVTWQETTGYNHKFLIDGFVVAFTENQLAVTFDGIWCGQVSVIDESEVLIPVLQVLGLPVLHTLEGSDRSSEKIRHYRYQINTPVAHLLNGSDANTGVISNQITPLNLLQGSDLSLGEVITITYIFSGLTGIDTNTGEINNFISHSLDGTNIDSGEIYFAGAIHLLNGEDTNTGNIINFASTTRHSLNGTNIDSGDINIAKLITLDGGDINFGDLENKVDSILSGTNTDSGNINNFVAIIRHILNGVNTDTGSIINSAITDPYSSYVALYLKGDGANNSSTFVDSSSSPKTLTRSGDTIISTAQSKYGGSSMYFDGAGDNLVVDSAYRTALDIGSNDFTVECWARFGATNLRCLYGTAGSLAARHFFLVTGSSNTQIIANIAGSNKNFTVPTLSTNTWHHIALCRNSNNLRLFLNGVESSTGAIANSTSISANSSDAWRVGSITSNYYMNGYIDSLRITIGIGRYTSNFNPETDTYLAY